MIRLKDKKLNWMYYQIGLCSLLDGHVSIDIITQTHNCTETEKL